ncbi:S1 RNA binding family protein [Nonomuraea polychroma]|uniref:S1 RNA binding family protein n=1 Tax=Nonomuraea polychroma TaxID=46176 RepID=A0A438M7T0_9ACTN|nr:S1 RNA-binding domain-containing protein [Nonomuraea polychroma]RVX41773.1 S1 RNA binding family protein [Nonomuraea polychroma]
MRPSRIYVRGLPLPVLLLELLAAGGWPPPGDAALSAVMPWFEDPVDVLTDVDQMRRESRALDWMSEDPATADHFRLARGGQSTDLVELPWLDTDLAVLIAVNRRPGDDVAIALDYRRGSGDPAVVASDWWTDPQQCAWRVVAPTFSAFAATLGVHGRRRCRYVGPDELRVQIWSDGTGYPITSHGDLATWLARQDGHERQEPFTFVIDETTTLRLAPRRSEHVVCAGGKPVLSAGEITFTRSGDAWRVSEISNQSTGYCPDVSSWADVQTALDDAGLDHPGAFTLPIVFRRCLHCGQLNIVKDDHFNCALCDEPLPTAWNADMPGEPEAGPEDAVAVCDVVAGTVVEDEGPFGPRIRLDGNLASMPAHIRDFPWRGSRADAVRVGQRVTAEVVSVDTAAGRIWLSLAATEHPELWTFLKGLRAGDVLTGRVADIQNFGVFIALDEGPLHPTYAGVGFVTIPELSWKRFEQVADVVRTGQRVRGEVLAVDTTNGEARLSLRALQPDPFQSFADNVGVGHRLPGTVTKIVPFGVFVEVADGIEGLIHKGELTEVPIDGLEQIVQPGDTVQVFIIDLDRDRRRLLLSRTRAAHDRVGGSA